MSKDFTKLDKKCVLVFSEELLNEFLTVVKRPKFRRFFSKEDIEEILETIQEYAEYFEVLSKITICRDIKDNFLLSLAKDSETDFLITGDKDLLELQFFEKTRILTITEFFEIK
ncbi:MAG: putative toxin-antitoxin system toxin component, PIN family [Cruoricaptor ignavus]|nr:putative toxin-antitoxin system toxin component, PIN family [Cruoricaptor ignavus]